MGFEPMRAEHNGLAVHLLNHSDTSSPSMRLLNLLTVKPQFHPPNPGILGLNPIWWVLEQSGAAEACWAHNPEVDGSKPSSANSSQRTVNMWTMSWISLNMPLNCNVKWMVSILRTNSLIFVWMNEEENEGHFLFDPSHFNAFHNFPFRISWLKCLIDSVDCKALSLIQRSRRVPTQALFQLLFCHIEIKLL